MDVAVGMVFWARTGFRLVNRCELFHGGVFWTSCLPGCCNFCNESPILAGARGGVILIRPCWPSLLQQCCVSLKVTKRLPIEFWHAFGGTRKPLCANCYRELMNEVCPRELEAALNAWIIEGLGLNLGDEAAGIIIDGKVLRGTRSEHARTMQILTALDQHTGCVLSETSIASDTNEAKTALEFLKSLVLKEKRSIWVCRGFARLLPPRRTRMQDKELYQQILGLSSP